MGRLFKSQIRKKLDSELLDLAGDFIVAASGAEPQALLQEKIDTKGPTIKVLAENVRQSDGVGELRRARNDAENFARGQSNTYGLGEGPIQTFTSVMDDLLGV